MYRHISLNKWLLCPDESETVNKDSTEILKTLRSMADRNALSGCFGDIPIDVYHHQSCPGVSSTQIKGILKRSYKHFLLEQRKETKAFAFGSALHCFVNEPDAFVNTYQIIYGKQSEMLSPGKIALSIGDFEAIQHVAKKLFAHPDAGPLLKDAQHELTYFSVDNETGILKKCRVDAIKNLAISDLKSCQDASPDAFARDSRKYLYRVSGAYYTEIVSEVLGIRIDDFYLIATEKTEPFGVKVYRISDRSIEQGRAEVRKALKLIQTVHEHGANAWTEYELGITDLVI